MPNQLLAPEVPFRGGGRPLTRDELLLRQQERPGIANRILGPHLMQGLQNVGNVARGAINFLGPQADVHGMALSSRETMESLRNRDWMGAGANALYTAAAPLGLAIPGTIRGIKGGTNAVLDNILPPSSGGRASPPSGVSPDVPRPLPTYPTTGPPKTAYDPKTKRQYPQKVQTSEERQITKQIAAAQRDINAGNYKPYFDVARRRDVDISKYPDTGAETTLAEASPRAAKAIARYENIMTDPAIRSGLQDAYRTGTLIDNSENWYFVAQLEREFVKELGAKRGRAAFLEKFVKPMAATTAKASPTANLRMAMYGNYLKKRGLPFPENAYDIPTPVGGFGVVANLRQHENLVPGKFFSARQNPKRHNFARNYLGDPDVSTIDAQMTEVMSGGKLQKPPGPSYGNYERVIAEEAAAAGVAPRNFQEVVWAGAKQMKEGARYPGSKPMIQIINEAIERTSRITGMSAKDVVRQGIIHSKIPIYGLIGASMAAVGGAGLLGAYDNQQQQVY